MQENAYRIMEAYARQKGEEPPLRFMLQELDVLETQEGQNFTGQTTVQKYNPLEVTKVAGLSLYTNQTDNVSSHSLYTRKGVGSQPPPAGTRYENDRQRRYSGDNRDEEDQEITEVARGIPARKIGTTNREEEIEAFPKTREIPHPQEITTKRELTT